MRNPPQDGLASLSRHCGIRLTPLSELKRLRDRPTARLRSFSRSRIPAFPRSRYNGRVGP